MKLYCLNGDPAKPCYILSFKGLLIMLDCGLNTQTVLNFLPLSLVQNSKFTNLPNWNQPRGEQDIQLDGELKEYCNQILINSSPEFSAPLDNIIDFAEIDVILISNYMNMLALPYITERTGFKGIVYATEPTLQIGRFVLEELVEFLEVSTKVNSSPQWKNVASHLFPERLSNVNACKYWKPLFSLDDVQSSLARVQIAGYDEKLDVFGAVSIMPVSSGFCLGSSNWIISSEYEKISYISGSSTLTTHPRPINQTALRQSNVILLTGLTQAPNVNPDGMLGELCMNVVLTLRNNGSVIIPCYPSGVVYDLFECLSTHLDNAGFSQIPMFFVSPVADASLAYSNILAEWLSSVKQNKVYIPDEPFPHASLVKNSRLKHYKHIYSEGFSTDFRQPCVVFCGHPSLRFGDIVHLIELWGSSPQHAIIFTEPDFPYLQALAPFQPLQMKTIYCPIETSLNFQQANKLIKELKPEVLVIPESYLHPPVNLPHKTDLVIENIPDKPIITFKCGDVIKLPTKRTLNKVYIDADVATSLPLKEVNSGVSVSSLTGVLQVKDNLHNIQSLSNVNSEAYRDRAPTVESVLNSIKYEWGTLNIDSFVKKLHQNGFNDIKVDQNEMLMKVIIILADSNTQIHIDNHNTHIICNGNETLRKKLKDIFTQCIQYF